MKTTKNYTLIDRVGLLFGWTETQINAAKAVQAFVDHLLTTRGASDTVKYLKESHRLLVRALAGSPDRCSLPTRIGLDRYGFPKSLPRVLRKPLYDASVHESRLALVLYSLYRELPDPAKALKLETIANPPSVDIQGWMLRNGWSGNVTDFLAQVRRFGWVPLPLSAVAWKEFHITNKSGPNGRAMTWAHFDAWALVDSPLWSTFQEMGRMAAVTVRPKNKVRWNELMHALDPNFTTLEQLILRFKGIARACVFPKWKARRDAELFLGRVSAKLEPAGKVRVFAIPDYWTQTLLKPLHQYAFDILRVIPTDSTFDQAAAVRRASEASQRCRNFWSFDLSAATDRFPIDLQVKLLEQLFQKGSNPVRYAQLWKQLLVGRSYQLSKSVLELLSPVERKHIQSVRYGTGQPMGAYSSWAIFALAHHCIVQTAAAEAGYQGWYYNYQILGDDIVMWGDEEINLQVADKYIAYCEAIGVGINLSKSVPSSDGTFEFAKNLVKDGVNLTPFHWKEWDRAFATPGTFNDFIKLMRYRGVEVTPSRAIAAWLHHRNIQLEGRTALWHRAFGKMPGLMPQLAILLFSPVGAYPTTVKQWSQCLQLSLRSMGDIDVAWPSYPLEAQALAATAEEMKMTIYDPLTVKVRLLFWEIWEQAGSSLASRLKDSEGRRKAWLRDHLDALIKKGFNPPVKVVEAYSNVSLIASETLTVYRKLYRSGLSWIYGPLAAGGMTDLSGDDLDLTPQEILQERKARSQRPLEDYLHSPAPEAQVISVPEIEAERDEIRAKISFASKCVMKAFQQLDRLLAHVREDPLYSSPEPEVRQASIDEILKESEGWVHPDDRPDSSGKRKSDYFQPVSPSVQPKGPMTTEESFILYRAINGKWPWDTEPQTPPVPRLKGERREEDLPYTAWFVERASCGDYDD